MEITLQRTVSTSCGSLISNSRRTGRTLDLLVGQLILAFILAMLAGPLAAITAESFSTTTRFTGIAAGINIGATVFGGTCPLLAAYLVHLTGNQLLPSFYIMGLAVVCLLFSRAPTLYNNQVNKLIE